MENKSIVSTLFLWGRKKKHIERLLDLLQLQKNDPTLIKLDLSNLEIGNKRCKWLSQALQSNNNLTVLWLSKNNIGDKGCEYLSQALQSNTTLMILNLSENSIRGEGVKWIGLALQSNRTLTKLDLSNSKIGDEACKWIKVALESNTTLTELNLSNNKFSTEGCEYLIQALQSNTTLTKLHISSYSDDIKERIKSYLRRNQSLCNQLHQAAQKGDLNTIKELVKKVSPFSQTGEDGNTTIHWAALADNLPIIQFLLQQGTYDLSFKTKKGRTPLDLAHPKICAQIKDNSIKEITDSSSSKTEINPEIEFSEIPKTEINRQYLQELQVPTVIANFSVEKLEDTKKQLTQIQSLIDKELEVKKEEDTFCSVCLEAKKSHALVPCGHLFCFSCISKFNNCPLCRQKPTSFIKIH